MAKAKKPESVAQILARKKSNAKGKTKKVKTPASKKGGVKTLSKKKKTTPKVTKKTGGKKKRKDSLKGLMRVSEYLAFIEFMATPKSQKKLKTQGDFARSFGVEQSTVSEWKNRDGYNDDLKKKRMELVKGEDITEAIDALNRKIRRYGNGQDVKILLQYAGEFTEKSQVDTREPMRELSTERKQQIASRVKKWKGK